MKRLLRHINAYRLAERSTAPLATMRVVVGSLVAFGALRFMAEGWVERLLGAPFRFHFYGFEWVPSIGPDAGYWLYALLSASGVAVALGYRYRFAAPLCLLAFTFAELQDATHYLNHYYLVVLLLGLLTVVPAGRAYSLDTFVGRVPSRSRVPAWCVDIFLVQLAIVYVCAGLAKVNADWLLRAMPLAIWLPERAGWPLLGPLFAHPLTGYVFSWAGCLYDLTIVAWLLWRPTRPVAYAAVLLFHGFTWLLFNIGLFPLIMIGATLVFFADSWHERQWRTLRGLLHRGSGAVAAFAAGVANKAVLPWQPFPTLANPTTLRLIRTRQPSTPFGKTGPLAVDSSNATRVGQRHQPTRWSSLVVLTAFVLVQVLLPARALAYPGPVAWSEEGYRFGWRVMLVEKSGMAEFTVVDGATGRRVLIDNREHLSAYQTKQMAIQPDFILQFAHHLAADYRDRCGFLEPRVYASAYVSLNGRRSRPLVDPRVDLAAQREGWSAKPWIQPFAQ